MNLLLAHLAGDYLLQTHRQAVEKTSRWGPAVEHAATYTLAHLCVTRNPRALAVIGVTHLLVDRYRLAKHIAWAKNQITPKAHRFAPTATGYPEDTPPWLAFWLMIITDNTMHLLINAWAVKYVK